MIVERRIENRIVAGPPIVSITKEQRRLIDYSKLRLDFAPYGDQLAAAQRLSKAFQDANADDEELSYWSAAKNTELRQQMLTAFFVRTEDFDGLYRLCKFEDFQCFEVALPWESLKELRARRPEHEQNNKWEFITLSRIALKRDPWDKVSAEMLVEESKALTRVEERINALKSGLDCLKDTDLEEEAGRDGPGSLIVAELENLVLDQGNDAYTITFWQSMVRKMSNSWSVGTALQNVFMRQGKDAEAVVFWRKIWPAWPNSDYFYAESCQEAGDFEEAIKFWFKWLELTISNSYEPELGVFAKSLQRTLQFNYEPWKVIQFWETSLTRSPADMSDIRRKQVATTFLQAPELHSVANSHEIIKKVAGLCAYDTEIVSILRASFERNHIQELEGDFWRSLRGELCDVPSSWYAFRLAQFHSLRGEFIEARKNAELCAIAIDDKLRQAIATLDLGCDSRNFWHQIVDREGGANWRSIKMLEIICCGSQDELRNSDVLRWKDLMRKHPSHRHLRDALERMFNLQAKRNPEVRREQIEFWKVCLSESRYCKAEYYLAQALKLMRDQCSELNSVMALEFEIDTWSDLLCYSYRDDYSVTDIVRYLSTALAAKADTVDDQPFQNTAQIWKEAEDIWSRALSSLVGRSTFVISKLQKHFDIAGVILHVLEADY